MVAAMGINKDWGVIKCIDKMRRMKQPKISLLKRIKWFFKRKKFKKIAAAIMPSVYSYHQKERSSIK